MFANQLYHRIADADPDAKPGEARRFVRHLSALAATKTADAFLDPKLTLAWLLSALGAPGYLVGALVPVRESGALLPQLALARWIERSRTRRWFWVAGSAGQGLAVLGMAAAALLLPGVAASWAIVGLLAIFAVSRAACSASYKDVAARTLAKGTRGTVSGTAGTVAAVVGLVFAGLLSFAIIPRTPQAIAVVIALAGVLWLLAAAVFSRLDEPEAQPGDAGQEGLAALVAPLAEDAELRRYITTRALLISTALAPPFLVLLGNAAAAEGEFGNLGMLILASSAAAIVSSYVWGRLSDRSSRKTLALAAALSVLTLAGAATVGVIAGSTGNVVTAGFLFTAQIAYQGARAGRKTHLTDMDADGQKSVYTALSNSVIGAMLLCGGALGVLADAAGPEVALAVLAVMSACALPVAWSLSEVQQEGGGA